MSLTIENESLQMTLSPGSSTWSVVARQPKGPVIEHAQMGLSFKRGRTWGDALSHWGNGQIGNLESFTTMSSSLKGRKVTVAPGQEGVGAEVVFAVPEHGPFLYWKMKAVNMGSKPVEISRFEFLRVGFNYIGKTRRNIGERVRGRGRIKPHIDGSFPVFYSNGWGSWNDSRVYNYSQYFHRSKFGWFNGPMLINTGTPSPKKFGRFASDMFGILGDRGYRTAVLAGFLSQKQHFGSLETLTDPHDPALSLWANGDMAVLHPGQDITTDWACLYFLHMNNPDPLGPYLDAVIRENSFGARSIPDRISDMPSPTGWCSWYQFYRNVDDGIVRNNIKAVSEIRKTTPLEYIQIDDGYQAKEGDWLKFNNTFPDGPAPLASEIKESGFKAGLWIAPFIVDPKSSLAINHPHWLLRRRGLFPGFKISGFAWNRFNRAIDPTHPEALEHIREIIRTAVYEWGFQYLKLDFLFAAALNGRYHDPTKTTAQGMRKAFEVIREAAGEETVLLGCGCPLGPAIGLFDAMRIGADVASNWMPKFRMLGRIMDCELDLPSVRNAIHNTLSRAPLHRRWWINDPDCLLIRSDTDLSLTEVRTHATAIIMSGGSLVISDDLPEVSEERKHLLQVLVPVIGKTPYVLDFFDSPTPTQLQVDLEGPQGRWHLIALFNWDHRAKDLIFNLEDGYLDITKSYWTREFWRGETGLVKDRAPERSNTQGVTTSASDLVLKDVPAHGCAIFMLKQVRDGPQYLGSDLHISQGLEVSKWDSTPGKIELTLKRPGEAEGVIDVALPGSPVLISMPDGTKLSWTSLTPGVFRVPVSFEHQVDISIEY